MNNKQSPNVHSNKVDLQLVGAGAVTSVGFSLPASVAAVQSGIDAFSETNFFDYLGEPIIGSAIDSTVDLPEFEGIDRASIFLVLAVEEALHDANAKSLASAKLILIAPDKYRPTSLPQNLIGRVQTAIEKRLLAAGWDPTSVNFQTTGLHSLNGSIAICNALTEASQWLSQPSGSNGDSKAEIVVIASFDSWLNSQSIRYGLTEERFLVTDSANGFIPGEAASAIVVRRSGDHQNASDSFRVTGVGLAVEDAPLVSDDICAGVGLGKAIDSALAGAAVSAHEIHHRLTNTSGEEYFFSESANAWARVLRKSLPKSYRYENPASTLGGIGAAFGVFLLGYSYNLFQLGKTLGANTLIQLSSDRESRGAIVCKSIYSPRQQHDTRSI